MSRKNRFARCGTAALAIILSACLTLFALPIVSLADTSVLNNTDANPGGSAFSRVSQDVTLEPTSEKAELVDNAGESAGTLASTQQGESDKMPSNKTQQTKAEVAIGGEVAHYMTLLVDGLEYIVEAATATASLVGWYGQAPKGDLAIPSQIDDGKTSYRVVSLGGTPGASSSEGVDSSQHLAGGGPYLMPQNFSQ